MNRILALVVAAALTILPWSLADARVIPNSSGNDFNQTTNPPTADLWCNGGQIRGGTPVAYTEICQDYLGDFLPTSTSGTQSLGTSSLPWLNVYSVSATNTGSENSGTAGTTNVATGVGGTAATQATVLGASVYPQGTAFLLAASSQVPVNATLMLVGGSGSSTSLTSQPEVSTTTIVGGSTLLPTGTYLIIASTASGQNMVFTSSTSSNASGLVLGAATRTITKNKTLLLWLDAISNPSVWREIAYGND